MTTERLLAIVRDRGCDLKLHDGRILLVRPTTPPLPGHPQAVTDALLRVLKIHRDRLIELLKKEVV